MQVGQQGRPHGGESGRMGPCSFAVAVTFALARCAMEQVHSYGPKRDLARLGVGVSRDTPRQTDLMIVAGPVHGPRGHLGAWAGLLACWVGSGGRLGGWNC